MKHNPDTCKDCTPREWCDKYISELANELRQAGKNVVISNRIDEK